MNDPTSKYQKFLERRETLLLLVRQIEAVLNGLGQATWLESLQRISAKLEDESFKVMVMGNFKNGKSTFINAMLGEEVLPAYATPCTAVINEVRWDEARRAVLYFSDPLPEPLPEHLPPEVQAHIEKCERDQVPPLEVPVEQLEHYVVIKDPTAKHGEATPYEKVVLEWPLQFCKNGVVLIDSPGLNEHANREKVTMDYIAHVDAVLFVLNCSQLAGQQEMSFFENYIYAAGHDSTFFVCNRLDTVRPRSEQDRVKEHGRKILTPKTALGERGVHFVSAINGLEGRTDDDPAMLASSGIPELEQDLATFLTDDRGRVKLLQPAKELQKICADLTAKVIPTQRSLLSEALTTIEEKFDMLQPQLEDARKHKDRILRLIKLSEGMMVRDVRDAANRFARELATEIPALAEATKTQQEIKLFTFKHKDQAEALVKEVIIAMDGAIRTRVNAWKKNTLEPILEKHSKSMSRAIEQDVEDFYVSLDQMQATLRKLGKPDLNGEEVSGKERLLASVAGFLVGDVYSGLHGARFGFAGLMGAVGAQIALLVAMALLGVVNPFVVMPVLLGGGLITGLLNAENRTIGVKKKVGEEFAKTFSANSSEFVVAVAKQVEEKTSQFTAKIEKSLNLEIQRVSEQIDAVVLSKKSGELEVTRRQNELHDMSTKVSNVSSALFQFASDLAITGSKPSSA